MTPVHDFQDLIVWQRSVDLIAEVYALTRRFPLDERYGMVSQMRRAACSVANNIAEGSGRATTRDLLHFATISRGSVKEIESSILVSRRLEFVTGEQALRAWTLAGETGKLLTRFRQSLAGRS
jgi:four helix bundle protein